MTNKSVSGIGRDVLQSRLDIMLSRRSLLLGAGGLAAATALPGLLTTNAFAQDGWTPEDIAEKFGSVEMADSWHSLVLAIIADRAAGGEAAAKALGQTYRPVSAELNPGKQVADIQAIANTGVPAFNCVPLEAPNVEAIYRAAAERGIPFTASYNSPAWKTPVDYGPEYSGYFAMDDRAAGREMARRLFDHLEGKGTVIYLAGLAGATASNLRGAGIAEVLKEYPNIILATEQNTDFSQADAQAKMENLLGSISQIDGVLAATDDIGIGAYNALRIRGEKRPIVSIDGGQQVWELIRDGNYLGSVNGFSHWSGGYFLVRLFDVLHGWVPEPAERMMFWQTTWVDRSNAAIYLDAFYKGDLPYDFARMSRVLHPEDWDTQQQLTPMDPNVLWQDDAKPDGYELPAGYDAASIEKIGKLYADHWVTRQFT